MKANFVKDSAGNIDILNAETNHILSTIYFNDLWSNERKLLVEGTSEEKKAVIERYINILETKIEMLRSIEF